MTALMMSLIHLLQIVPWLLNVNIIYNLKMIIDVSMYLKWVFATTNIRNNTFKVKTNTVSST